MIKALFCRKKTTRQFKEFYAEWVTTLESSLLPSLRSSLMTTSSSSSATSAENLLSTHVDSVHSHFQLYYKTLDLAAVDDVSQILYPEWRNLLEKPFLWMGDYHPNLFTTLIRSFLEDDDDDDSNSDGGNIRRVKIQGREALEGLRLLDRPWHVVMAWKNPSDRLMSRIGEIERGLRLMVPSLMARAREAQGAVVDKVVMGLGRNYNNNSGEMIGEKLMEVVDEMTRVVLDANRMRRSVMSEILAETDVYQSALFLEGLAEFVVGCRDSDMLCKFKRCKMMQIDQ